MIECGGVYENGHKSNITWSDYASCNFMGGR